MEPTTNTTEQAATVTASPQEPVLFVQTEDAPKHTRKPRTKKSPTAVKVKIFGKKKAKKAVKHYISKMLKGLHTAETSDSIASSLGETDDKSKKVILDVIKDQVAKMHKYFLATAK